MQKAGKSAKIYGYDMGDFYLEEENGFITKIFYLSEKEKYVEKETEEDSPVLKDVSSQLKEYLNGDRTEFTIPLAPTGTTFQKKVWAALQMIPYGQVKTYGQIAKEIGCPGAARAVGMACHNNPIMILIPCHRVVGKGGTLTGFACGISVKQFLLNLEGITL